MDWIIGGTKDSRDFIREIKKNNLDLKNIIVTTVSEYGKNLIEEDVKVFFGALNEEKMERFVLENKIARIFDFSHPYAVEVSKNAMSVSKRMKIKYFRFEREMLDYKNGINFYNIDELIDFLEKTDEKIMCTLGSNNIEKFKNLKNLDNIYIRILPVTDSLKKTEETGIKAKNIIGLQGPFSKDFNKALFENYKIKYMVTKESGTAGGEAEKIEACRELGIIPVVLKRPKINYIWKTSDMKKIFEEYIKGLGR